MKILVIGSGGREHAIVRELARAGHAVFALPGNDGMGQDAKLIKCALTSFEDILQNARAIQAELVVIGPEGPLIDGLADYLRAENFLVFGPSAKAARLEGSKSAAKEFMKRHGVSTAHAVLVSSVEETERALKHFAPPYVLKADGLAAGKGVVVTADRDELLHTAHRFFVERVFGENGSTALLEEYQAGYELSYFVLTNGRDFQALPVAQDHKRLRDQDQGPNTGGMGTIAPWVLSDNDRTAIHEKVVIPTIQGLMSDQLDYRGVIFIGLMMSSSGPVAIEYNTRFGDPETQVLLPLLNGDWGEIMRAFARGECPALHWKDEARACVVLAAEGYPEAPLQGAVISGGLAVGDKSEVLVAGAKLRGSELSVTGGRVLNVIGKGSTIAAAVENAYARVKGISFAGMQFRTDIGSGHKLK